MQSPSRQPQHRARARILGQQPFRIDFQFFSRWIPILFKFNKSKNNSLPPHGRHHLLLNTVPATLTQSYLQHNFALGLNDKSSVPNGKLHFSGLKIRIFWVFFWATNEHNSGIFRVYSGLFFRYFSGLGIILAKKAIFWYFSGHRLKFTPVDFFFQL